VVVSATEQAEDMMNESRRKRDAWLAELVTGLTEEEWAVLRTAAPVLERLAQS
jgi:DNA-binding MarR family transcriptional regulator